MRHASELRSTKNGGLQGPGGKRLSRRTLSVSAVIGALALITASAWLGTMTTQAKTKDTAATTAAKAAQATTSPTATKTRKSTPWVTRTRTSKATPPATTTKTATTTTAPTATATKTSAAGNYELPPANAIWDYQIGGPYTPIAAVGIVDRDHTANAEDGKYNVCYVNGYQTQPGESKSWPTAALLKDKNGKLVEDKEWPGEYMVDTRTATSRTAIMSVVGAWIDSCASKGFKAVEVDNLDSFTRDPSKQLTETGNMTLAKQFVERAHGKSLAIGQKNTVELATKGRAAGFDFAVVESCQLWEECDGYTDVYGTQVYEVEYVEEGGTKNFEAACKARGAKISITYRDVLVKPKGSSGYTFKYC
jgi:glycosyl hydrolase family 114